MAENHTFSEETIDRNPFNQFKKWYGEHLMAGIAIPDSLSLATSTKSGRVSLRTVLLKDYNERGFIFFTNYNSRKGTQLTANPYAAMLFYWPESGRQVRIEGVTEKISEEESMAYFRTRPVESQLSAWASEQSSVIPNRQHLEKRFLTYKFMFADKSVEKPENWGGFLLIPEWFEFWQDGKFRLHDRLTFSKKKGIWIINRLAP